MFASSTALGLLPGDDIDAIELYENWNGVFDPASGQDPWGDLLVFSLADGSPTLAALGASPGDLLVPNKVGPGRPPMLAFPSRGSGLAPEADLNALKGDVGFLWERAPHPDQPPLPEPSACVVNPIGGPEGWTPRAPLPIGREGGFAVIIDQRIYVGQGASIFGDDSFHFIYDIPSDTWFAGAPAPIGRAELTGVCAEEEGQAKVFAIGGRSFDIGSVLDDVYVYDPPTDTWSPRTPMPTPRAGLGAAWVSSNNTIYVFGGRDGTSPHEGTPFDVVEAYDVDTGIWSTMTPMPIPMMDVYSTVYDPRTHEIYVIGGYDGYDVSGAVQIYDVASDTWSLGAGMPTPRSNLLAGFCGGKIHAIGGYSDWVGEFDVNEAYDPLTDTWGVGYSPLPDPRSELLTQGISTGSEIYSIGAGIFGEGGKAHDVYTCGIGTIEVDHFDGATASLTLIPPTGPEQTIEMSGSATHVVFFEGDVEGVGYDDDSNGLDEVNTKMAELDLYGQGSLGLGLLRLGLDPSTPSTGIIEEIVNFNAGLLDLPPFGMGAADSFFDVFVEIDIGGQVFYPDTPIHMEAIVTHKPEGPGDTYVSEGVTPPLDILGSATGWAIGPITYTPNSGP